MLIRIVALESWRESALRLGQRDIRSTANMPERKRTRALRINDGCVILLSEAGSGAMKSIIVGRCDSWGRGWMNGYVR